MSKTKKILLAFYGDDFTGSTDALEFITRAGARAVLFIEPPTEKQLEQFPELDVIGVAGKTRALSPEEMGKILIPAFKQLKATGARQVHYKVCSTFDSSPSTGSIGKAIDCGSKVFNNKLIPVLGGMPALGRYCLFGNLFAKMGIGSNGKIYRLDRHPSMSKHPVTPADESDLRIHLGKQTNKKFGLIDVLQLEKPVDEWDCIVKENEEIVLIDALYESQMLNIGRWLDQIATDNVQFSVGGSGIEATLGEVWNEKGLLKRRNEWNKIEKADPLLVISGSCSPVTAAQIEWAKKNRFAEVVIDAVKVSNDGTVCGAVMEKVKEYLDKKQNLIVHTGSKQEKNLSSERLGTALGTIAREAVNNNIKRVIISGGDTSSYAARAMEIDAVEMIAPLVSGAPLCKAYSVNKKIEGLEVNFKGGQVGAEDYFGIAVGK